MKFNKLLVLGLALGVSLGSCKKDDEEVNPDNSSTNNTQDELTMDTTHLLIYDNKTFPSNTNSGEKYTLWFNFIEADIYIEFYDLDTDEDIKLVYPLSFDGETRVEVMRWYTDDLNSINDQLVDTLILQKGEFLQNKSKGLISDLTESELSTNLNFNVYVSPDDLVNADHENGDIFSYYMRGEFNNGVNFSIGDDAITTQYFHRNYGISVPSNYSGTLYRIESEADSDSNGEYWELENFPFEADNNYKIYPFISNEVQSN